MIRFRIVPQSPAPIFAQIVEQVRQATAQGTLRPGEQIPTVRELAKELLVNPNTIARAYQDLERAGLVVTRRGAGTFAARADCVLSSEERSRILEEKLREFLTEAVHLGLPRKLVSQRFLAGMSKFKWPED